MELANLTSDLSVRSVLFTMLTKKPFAFLKSTFFHLLFVPKYSTLFFLFTFTFMPCRQIKSAPIRRRDRP